LIDPSTHDPWTVALACYCPVPEGTTLACRACDNSESPPKGANLVKKRVVSCGLEANRVRANPPQTSGVPA
jgi:hypothetical protein